MDLFALIKDNVLIDADALRTSILPEITILEDTPQTLLFHGEGSVLNHTALACKEAYNTPTPVSGLSMPSGLFGPTLQLAALLHDSGKPRSTKEVVPGRYSSHGHAETGAQVASKLYFEGYFDTFPLGVFAAVQSLIRSHMWTYGIDSITSGRFIRASHLADPTLLKGVWDADSRGRISNDPESTRDRVEYAKLVLDEAAPSADFLPITSTDARVRRLVLQELAHSGDVWKLEALKEETLRNVRPGSLTYTMGLPGVGKSTFAKRWEEQTGGTALTARGRNKEERKKNAYLVYQEAQVLLGKGEDVLIDATHLSRKSRDPLSALATRYRTPLRAVLVRGTTSLAVQRQVARASAEAVPGDTIRSMSEKFAFPAPDEYDTLHVQEQSGVLWEYTASTRWD